MKILKSDLSKLFAIAALLVLIAFSYPVINKAAFSKYQNPPDWVKEVGAKTIPTGKRIFKVNSYGAVNDGKTMNTTFIQKAIDACAANGGGIVAFDTGQ